MFGCYRKGDANDPETYTAAIAAILAEYEPEVVHRVTDPRTGIPRKMKFMPNPAEVSEFCEETKKAVESERYLRSRGYVWMDGKWQQNNQSESSPLSPRNPNP